MMQLSIHFRFLALLLAIGVCLGCGSVRRTDGGSGLLQAGTGAPDLKAIDHQDKRIDLRELSKNQQVLVYFYPKDNTPGCTKEACAVRDTWQKFTEAKIEVLGVSSDSQESHRKFASEHQLPFSLIADVEGHWADAFGVGRTLGFYSRVSFLIGRGGSVLKVYQGVDPALHANQVLTDAKRLQ